VRGLSGLWSGCLIGATDADVALGLNPEDLAAHFALETLGLLDGPTADRHAFTCDGPLRYMHLFGTYVQMNAPTLRRTHRAGFQ
jgi:hypothetical protein